VTRVDESSASGAAAGPADSLSRVEVAVAATEGGWECVVVVHDRRETQHRVRVTRTDLARFDPSAADPVALVRASFDFLLEREPNESILPAFDLSAIGRYFPEYEKEIGQRLRD
jgi:hypothetical protein